jgi:phosphoglycerol transferase MdoB-like AlkP superfamily enzyme
MVFYASVSGHSSYKWNANAQARKHREEYEKAGYNYSEGPASYLAANMDFDKSLELLIKKLDEKGKLGDTVIAIVGDHYPYELSINEVNEISKYKKDAVVEVNRSNFILWNSEMDNVKVEKVGSQIDVMPTIYNAFGVKYDSRLFIGDDILSTTPGLAIFGNRSWVSDKGTYFSASREFIPKEGVEIPDNYVSEMNRSVNSKITMSKMIIENNYYKKISNN